MSPSENASTPSGDGHDHPHPHPHPHEGEAAEAHAHPHPHPHDEGHDHAHPHPHPHGDSGHGHDHGDHGHDHGHGHSHGHGDHEHEHPTGIKGFVMGLFMPHSHDAADSIDNAMTASSEGIRAVKISLAALMVTALLQVVLVLITSSVALLADTIHNFSDALTSIPLWIAFVLGRRPANRRYTYGYRRAEDLAGLFIVGMITFSAILAGWESIHRLIDPQPVSNIPLLIAAGLVGFAGNELVAVYRIRTGRKIGSAALVADGLHARTDGFTSLAVVFGALGVAAGFPLADPVIGLFITVAILGVLRGALKSIFGRLMDAVDPELVDQIERVASGVNDVHEVDAVRVRWIGHRLEASLHTTVDCKLTVADGHRIAEDVRHALFHDIRNLDSILVHVDPCEHDDGNDFHAKTRGHDPAGTPARRPGALQPETA